MRLAREKNRRDGQSTVARSHRGGKGPAGEEPRPAGVRRSPSGRIATSERERPQEAKRSSVVADEEFPKHEHDHAHEGHKGDEDADCPLASAKDRHEGDDSTDQPR